MMPMPRLLFVLALTMLAMPVMVWPGVWYPFVTPKVWYAYAVTTAVVAGVAWLVWRQPWRCPDRSPLLWALVAQACVTVLATIVAVDPARSWWGTPERRMGALTLLTFPAWAVATACVISTRARWHVFVGVAALSLACAVASGCVVASPGLGWAGTYGNAAYAGEAQILLIALSAMLAPRHRVAWVGIAIGLFVLGMAGTRGALLGLGVGTALALIVMRPSPWTALVALAPVAVVPYLGTVDTLLVRLRLWRHTWRAIWQYPVFGWGPDSFGLVFASTLQPGQIAVDWFDQAHNVILDTVATTGLLGLTAHVAVWVAFGLTLRTAYRRRALARAHAAMLAGAGAAIEVSRLALFAHPTGALSVSVLFTLTLAAGRGFLADEGWPYADTQC